LFVSSKSLNFCTSKSLKNKTSQSLSTIPIKVFLRISRIEVYSTSFLSLGIVEMNSPLSKNSIYPFSKFVGKKLFLKNCNVCHENKGNIIIPEKNLKQETLKTNGMYSMNAISYQIINGKNGMPAFGGKLSEKEIKEISTYILSPEI
jgi:cytochrome c6